MKAYVVPQRAAGRWLAAEVGGAALVFLLGQQGARLGPWLPPRTVPAWGWALLALAIVCLPPARRTERAGPLLGSAVA
ncbi:MAG TPA: hypothetical protein VFO85_00540, partial [Vicinamibacteria bacterium]|nr:hypothetical protein [Vicinamibacteria bacterium]